MNEFLFKLLKFFVFSVITVTCLFIIILSVYFYKLNNLKLDDNINTLILGDSQTQTAINDSIFTNAVNYSHNSEHYLLTYNVLKFVVKNNPQIKNLILGCSFHNISAFSERYLFGQKNTPDIYSKDFYSRYLPVLDNDSKLYLIENNFPAALKSIQPVTLKMITSITDNYSEYQDYPFIGKYYPGRKRVLNDSEANASAIWHFYTDSTGTQLEDLSSLQSEYLKKIISFCKEKNIKLFLLNTPVHPDYLKLVPQKFISSYYSLMKELEDSDKVVLLDYPDFKYPDDYFGDGNHLNRQGANAFTQEIMKAMSNE